MADFRMVARVHRAKRRIVKTPGKNRNYHKMALKAGRAKCGTCELTLNGVSYDAKQARKRTVDRAYGGNMCHQCVKGRIMRAFLTTEQLAFKAATAKKALDSRKASKAKKK